MFKFGGQTPPNVNKGKICTLFTSGGLELPNAKKCKTLLSTNNGANTLNYKISRNCATLI